jgi:hypothetical protein
MKRVSLAAFVLVLAGAAPAGEPAFQASLLPNCAIHPSTATIRGLTLSLWGHNEQRALALGVVNGTIGNSSGLSLGALNYGETYRGAQWGFVNVDSTEFRGWQLGLLNYCDGGVTGLQSGWINYAARLNAVQVGLLNVADRVDFGVQVGLVNIMMQNKQWFGGAPESLAPVMAIVNWRL